MNIKTILQLHIYLWFPACKPFYIIFLFKLLWEKLHQISQTLNNVWINGWNITLKMDKLALLWGEAQKKIAYSYLKVT